MFIILQNEFGATFKPKGSTFHWNYPLSVENAVNSLDEFSNGIW